MMIDAGPLVNFPLHHRVFQDASTPPRGAGKTSWWAAHTWQVVQNLLHATRFLSRVKLEVNAAGTCTLTHASGTAIALRADGNVDILPARNFKLNPGVGMLFDCDDPFWDTDEGVAEIRRRVAAEKAKKACGE